MIFLTAAEEPGLAPAACLVVEDASSGVQAAKAGRIAALGWGGWTTRRYSRRRARTWW
jgi:HAD superfamily hydrolase (TIGR01509 family)